MTRRAGALVLAAALLAAASACGSDDTTDPPPVSAGSTPSSTPATAEPPASSVLSSTTSTPSTPSTPSSAPTTVPAPDPTGPAPDRTAPLAGTTIVVDPGHNGANSRHTAEISRLVDAGGFQKACNTTGTATDDGYPESAFNWSVANLLADRLRDLGATVVLTRPDDEGWGPCIDERGRTASTARAEALVSIHADGAAAGEHGFHVIRPGAVAGYTDGIVEPSAQLAQQVRDALVGAGFTPATYVGGGGVMARTDLGTLNHARVPVVMLEAGNMRNAGDAAELRSPAGQARMADALAAALVAHLGGR